MTNPKLERAQRQSPESFTTPKFTFPKAAATQPDEAAREQPETPSSRDVPVPCVPPEPIIQAAAQPPKFPSPAVDVFDPRLRAELEARPLRLSSARWMQRIDGWKCPACETPLHVHAGERFERTALRIPRHAVADAERRRCPLFGLVSWETMPSESNAFTERVHEATGRYAVEFAHLILRNARRIQIRACGVSSIRNRMEENELRVRALTTNSSRGAKIEAWSGDDWGNPSTWFRFVEFPLTSLRVHSGPAPLRENTEARLTRARRTLVLAWADMRGLISESPNVPGLEAEALLFEYMLPRGMLDKMFSGEQHMTARDAIEALLHEQPDLGRQLSVDQFAVALAKAFDAHTVVSRDDDHEERSTLELNFEHGESRLVLTSRVTINGLATEERA